MVLQLQLLKQPIVCIVSFQVAPGLLLNMLKRGSVHSAWMERLMIKTDDDDDHRLPDQLEYRFSIVVIGMSVLLITPRNTTFRSNLSFTFSATFATFFAQDFSYL